MNTLGSVFRITTWGESHGEAVGCLIDGCPAGMKLKVEDINLELQRDVPDRQLGTPRREPNRIEIMSGLYGGVTIGTPISIVIYNDAAKSMDYEPVKFLYRPGHAEFTYHKRYGVYNPYGGGRASGRECIARLAAGAVAKKILSSHGIKFESSVDELAGIACDTEEGRRAANEKCIGIGAAGDSSGGIVSLRIRGLPAGIGSPVFGKLHALLMYAMATIGGVKGVECGPGFEAAQKTASTFNDHFEIVDGDVRPSTNNAGGVLGGISTGLDIKLRVAVKPTPSISKPQKTVNWKTNNEEILALNGRFDVNFTPRVAPILESMAAIVLTDQMILSGCVHPLRIGLGNNDQEVSGVCATRCFEHHFN